MHETAFIEAVKKICQEDNRYDADAYLFVREALDFTAKMLNKPAEAPGRHVTGAELLEGIRTYGLHEFGPVALTVFNTWGIKTTKDFGEIVFNLVNSGVLGKTDEDRKEDFANGYDFFEAFSKPFLPATTPSGSTNKRKERFMHKNAKATKIKKREKRT